MDNAEKMIEKIKSDRIRPRPVWVFSASEISKWLCYVFFILMGALAFSIILFAISVSGFDLLQHLKHSRLEAVFVLLPFLWLGILVFFLGASVASIRNTGRAYKISFHKWIALSTGLSMTLGTIFFISGGARYFEQKFETEIESYQSILEKKIAIWSQPELGTLSGEIMELTGDTLSLKDFENNIWKVDISRANVAPRVLLESSEQIKMNGKKTGLYKFSAESVKPWGGIPGQCKMNNKN